MFRFILIFYLIINSTLFIKFKNYTYFETIEDIQIINQLPNIFKEIDIIKNFKEIKIKKPKKKQWDDKLITSLGSTRYLNYGANLKFNLSGGLYYCINVPKALKIYNVESSYFQLSSNYKIFYTSSRGLPKNNCFQIEKNSTLITNIDVMSDKNIIYINKKNIKINYSNFKKINPILLVTIFLFFLFIINFFILFIKKNDLKI